LEVLLELILGGLSVLVETEHCTDWHTL
jgi:hypothetical protein